MTWHDGVDIQTGPPAPCDCDFHEESPKQHAMLLRIEELTAPYAVRLVTDLISGGDLNVGDEKPLIGDPDDFGRFVGQHNWKDPVGMYMLAQSADWLAGHEFAYRWTKTRAVAS